MIQRLTGQKTSQWVQNQLTSTKTASRRNRHLLGYEFAAWLSNQHAIAATAADELRGILMETMGRDHLTIQDYLDGIPEPSLERHLTSLLGFLSLDRFKAPAALIAADHFVRFLLERGLTKPSAFRQSQETISALEIKLKQLFKSEWASFAFLDPLRPVDAPAEQ